MADFRNPLPGDEVESICVDRQVQRGVGPEQAKRVCQILQKALVANKLDVTLSTEDLVIVPVLYTREGVHNGALKPWEEIVKAAPTIEGTPFFINQSDEHEQGKVPPLEDVRRIHGINLDVELDEGKRLAHGRLGLFKPEVLERHGATPKRVAFQRALIEAVKAGGKFAVSIGYWARIAPALGTFKARVFNRVERDLEVHSTSIVPRGAEHEAIMNALTEQDEPPSETPSPKENSPKGKEGLNTQSGQSGRPKNMAAPSAEVNAWLHDASLDAVASRAPQVNALVQEKVTLRSEANAAREQAQRAESAMNQARTAIANALGKSFDTLDGAVEVLVNSLKERDQKVTSLETTVNGYREKEQSAAKERLAKAKKLVANVLTDVEVKEFEDQIKDPAVLANTFERFAAKAGHTRLPAAGDLPASESEVNQDDELELEKRAFSNLEKDFNYTDAPTEERDA